MTEDQDEIAARLTALLEAGTLPRSATESGTMLLQRLDAPVRVSLFGLPAAGRFRIANLVAGAAILPETMPMPTFLLHYGAAPRTVATLSDGSKATWTGLPWSEIDAADAAYLDLAQPLPGLRDFAILSLAADESEADQIAAMDWAATRTDISLWLSRRFTGAEAGLWRRAPDRLKDHAYLVLTEQATPQATPEGFRASFAVPPEDAEAHALLRALDRCASQGREAYLDHALMFLSRFEGRRFTQARPAPMATETPSPERMRTRPMTRPVTRPISRPLTRPLTRAEAESARPKTRPVTSQLAVALAAPAPVPAPSQVPRRALSFLRTRAEALQFLLDAEGEPPERQVLGFCLETVEELAEKVADREDDPIGDEVEEMVMEASDVIMLLQGEEGIGPATDAVTLLLQLRRDLETRCAA